LPKQALGTLGVASGLHFGILVTQVEQTLGTQRWAAQVPDTPVVAWVVASDLHFVILVLQVERTLQTQGLWTSIVAVALCLTSGIPGGSLALDNVLLVQRMRWDYRHQLVREVS